MAVAFKTGDSQQIATTAGAIYTNASGETSFVTAIRLHNTNTTSETVKIYMVPDSGGSVGTAGTDDMLENITLTANETLHIGLEGGGHVFSDTNDTVQAETTTASKVNVWVTARVDT